MTERAKSGIKLVQRATREMTDLTLVLLPGLDGSGLLFRPLVRHLPSELRPIVVAYPPDQPVGYDELLPLVLRALPTSAPFAILGESFSGPLALMAASHAPKGLRGVILCASFVRNPLLVKIPILRHLVRGPCFRFAPEFVRAWALLGRYSTPELRGHLAEALATVSPQVLAHRVRMVLQVDVRRQLRCCPAPILYLQGAHDRVVGGRNLRDIIADCPSAQVARLPAPHFVLQAQPAAAAAAVSKFLSAAAPSNPPLQRSDQTPGKH